MMGKKCHTLWVSDLLWIETNGRPRTVLLSVIPQELGMTLLISGIGPPRTVLLRAQRQTLEEVNLLAVVSPKATNVAMQGNGYTK